MKRSIIAVAAAVCLFAGSGAALAEETLAGLTIEGGGTIIMQGTNEVNDGSEKGRNDATYSIDLEVSKELDNGGKVFMHLEAGSGDGLDGNGLETYGGVNGDAGDSEDRVEVTEFWYEQSLFSEKLAITFGKLNPTSYFDENEFANDENTQFVSPMFVNNAVIYFPDNNLGLRATYSPIEMLDITYSYMSNGWDNIDTNGFNAIQVTVKPFEGANYRAMAWTSNEELTEFDGGDTKGGYGFALSLDQAVTEAIGVFGRFGYADPSVYELSMSWSVGAIFNGSMWSRDNDTAGIAVGQILVSGDASDAAKIANPNFKDDSETQAELFYSFAVSENVFISPAVQYINKPAGGNAATDDDAFVYGIRTHLSF